MPTEIEICAEFLASRTTVREALRGLVALGLVVRRQGSGSMVIAPAPRAAFVQTIGSLSELFQFTLTTHFAVHSMRLTEPPPPVAQRLGAPPGSRFLRVWGLRREHAQGEPICWTESWIPERLAWLRPELPGCVGPFYALIEQRSGERILEAVQEIAAEPMLAPIARRLARPPGAPALQLLRRYLGADGLLIGSFNWHPADSFIYRIQLQRTAAE